MLSNKTKLTLCVFFEKFFFILTFALGTAAVVAFLMGAAGEAPNGMSFFKEIIIRLGFMALSPLLGWLAIMTWCAKLYSDDLYKVFMKKAYAEIRMSKK